MSTKQELEQEGYAEADICAVSLCVVTLIPVGNAIVITYGEPYGLHCIQSDTTAYGNVERLEYIVVVIDGYTTVGTLGRKAIIKSRACENECLEVTCVEIVHLCEHGNTQGMVGNFTFPEPIVLAASGINIPETSYYRESAGKIEVCGSLYVSSVERIALSTIILGRRVDETATNAKVLC